MYFKCEFKMLMTVVTDVKKLKNEKYPKFLARVLLHPLIFSGSISRQMRSNCFLVRI